MADPSVAIVGSGIVGTTIAYLLTRHGHTVEIFEKGPAYEYPPARAFAEQVFYLHDGPAWMPAPDDVQGLSQSGSYPADVNRERSIVEGGSATIWEALALRLLPRDFQTRRACGYGADWPLTYEELEPYYCRAEALLGVAGTDADNPAAPPRSHAYPLPPFELAYDDRILAGRLRPQGIVLHTTPQARTRLDYDGRPACVNLGFCTFCPIGARYSPHHHLARVVESGHGTLRTDVSVRRLVRDRAGHVRAIVWQENDSLREQEQGARIFVIAAGAVESARLLLLSADSRHPDGIGHAGGHVGQHLMFHHTWFGSLEYDEALYPGRMGGWTAQCQQFCDPPGRGRHGGVKVEFTSQPPLFRLQLPRIPLASGQAAVEVLRPQVYTRLVGLMGESTPGPTKYVSLSEQRDRFGDPFAHVHYEASDFDQETYRFGREVFERLATGTGAGHRTLANAGSYASGHHHMGTCRMGASEADSVTDRHCRVHGVPNLFVVGGASFASAGAVNPTLTMVALAIRVADNLLEQLR
jgi:glucose dehydrogenase